MTNREDIVKQTKDGYDAMAKDFAGTRMNFWTELTGMVRERLGTGDKMLDLGCGNARFYREISDMDVSYYGSDISAGLLAQARKYHPELELTECDARQTTYPDGFFDMVVSFAVVHHMPGRKAQKEYFEEVARVLSPGGTAVITSWNIWKTKKRFVLSQYLHNFWKPGFVLGDTIMSFTHHKENRFVHAFRLNTLKKLAESAGLVVESADSVARASKKGKEENFVLVLKKPNM